MKQRLGKLKIEISLKRANSRDQLPSGFPQQHANIISVCTLGAANHKRSKSRRLPTYIYIYIYIELNKPEGRDLQTEKENHSHQTSKIPSPRMRE